MKENIKVLISEEEVNEKIKEMGEKISREYAGKELHMICVLKGGVFFMTELAKRITVPVSMDFMAVSSYAGTQSTCKRCPCRRGYCRYGKNIKCAAGHVPTERSSQCKIMYITG